MIVTGAIVVGVIAPAAVALAATASSRVPAPLPSNQDIVVTATRHAEQASQVPVSIVARDRSALDRDRIVTFADLARSTPGLAERGAFGGTAKIAIRGIASNIGAATTAVYIDDTPVQVRTLGAAGVFANTYPAFFDLARVEVLRGPQGTLFGEGSEGGMIRFITPDPDLRKVDAYGKASLATTRSGAASWLVGQAISLPILADVAALRVSVSRRRDGGWIDRVPYMGIHPVTHDANRGDVTTARAALRLALGSGLVVQPAVYYQRAYTHDTQQYWEASSRSGRGRYVSGQTLAQPMLDRFVVPAIKIEKDLGTAVLIASSSWLARRNASSVDYTTHLLEGLTRGALSALPGVPQYAVPAVFRSRQQSFVQEVRVASQAGHPIAWVAGLHYANERQRIEQAIVDPLFDTFTAALFGCTPAQCFGQGLLPENLSYRAADRSRDRRLAAFGSIDWRLIERLTLTTGARAEKTISTFENAQDGPFNHGPSGGRVRVAGTRVTPRLALRYDLAAGGIVYASAARGARPGRGNTGVPAAMCAGDLAMLGVALPKAYRADDVWTYEVGAKRRWGSTNIQGSVFASRWTGIQQSIALPNCGFSFTTNLGAAVSRGFDLQVVARPIAGFDITASLAYTDAHHTRNVRLGGGPLLVGAGDTLPVPPWQARISGRYERYAGDHVIGLQIDYDHASSYRAHPALPAFNADPVVARADATDLVGARMTVTRGNWRLTAFADNLLNANDRLYRTHDSPSEPTIRVQGFRPRTLGLELTWALGVPSTSE